MTSVKRKKKAAGFISRRNRLGMIFTLPAILGLILVFIPAMVLSFRLSISNIKFLGNGYELPFAGIEHYHYALFVDPQFRRVLLDSLSKLWVQVLIISIFSLFMAVVINQKFRGRTVARAILFMPVILATGLINKVDAVDTLASSVGISSLDTGALNGFDFIQLEEVLQSIDFMPQLVNIVIAAVNGLYDVVLNSGVQILIFLAGLQSISPSLYEAGYVDGITPWQAFWKITLPLISPLMLVNVVYAVIASFIDSKNQVMQFIQNLMGTGSQYSYSSALSWIYFTIVFLAVAMIMLLSKKLVFYQN